MSGIPAGAGSLLGKRLGKYEILALLALGGTAEIYLARIGGAAGFEKYVVVKCLHDHLADDQEFVKMFLDEARLAAHLDHSNIVQTMELGEHEERYFMVMEFLAGLSLAMVVRRAGERLPEGRIPAPLVLNMMAQACAGLHYAHERAINGKALNIVHRDISPQNLVVSFEGVVKVVDFGIAKAEQRQTATRAGTIKGKFAYMSPEQCVATNVDRRTDVFALGVIAHEMLTGRRLFKRNSPYETYQAVIDCAVDRPSKVNTALDPALDELIMRSVAKDKDNRYPTAEAFGDALLGYLHHRGKGSGPGDIARFFDDSFAQEIEEHGARMRELISGRDLSVDTGVQWGTPEEEAAEARRNEAAAAEAKRDEEEAAEAKRNQTVDLSAKRKTTDDDEPAMALETVLMGEGALSDVLDGMGSDGGDGDGDDSDMPADRTRIETNPLEKLASMNLPTKTPSPGAPKGGQAPAQRPETQPAPLPRLPSVSSTPAKGQRVAPQKMPPSGPLPLPPAPLVPGPLQAPPGQQRPAAARFPNVSNMATMIADDLVPSPELARTGMAADPIDPDHGTAMQEQQAINGGQRPSLPMDYPVMNPEFSQQMLSGAVFPSAPVGSRANAPTSQSASMPDPTGRPLPGHAPGHAPGHHGPGRVPDSGPQPAQHAANMMSPVGQQYPQHVDWEQAAAAPVRRLPPWMMIALFVVTIGVTIAVMILVIKLLR